VIRALRACLRRPELRRIVGVVALLAFLFVVALGAAHVGEKQDASHVDHCGVCHAAALIGTSESFAAPQLVEILDAAAPVASHERRAPVAAEPRRAHAPRGPPSLA
jgi:hypothetical protein